jgi:hypothetical protein
VWLCFWLTSSRLCLGCSVNFPDSKRWSGARHRSRPGRPSEWPVAGRNLVRPGPIRLVVGVAHSACAHAQVPVLNTSEFWRRHKHGHLGCSDQSKCRGKRSRTPNEKEARMNCELRTTIFQNGRVITSATFKHSALRDPRGK